MRCRLFPRPVRPWVPQFAVNTCPHAMSLVFPSCDELDKIVALVQWADDNGKTTLVALEKFMLEMHLQERVAYLIPAQPETCLRYHRWEDVTKYVRFVSSPAHIEKIDNWCFLLCLHLTRITFPMSSSLYHISTKAFASSALVEITIPDSVVTIAAKAFEECKHLERVIFGQSPSLKSIGKEAFRSSGLKEIEIPDSVQILDNECFLFSTKLERVSFRDNPSLKQIGLACFAGCHLRSFSLPLSVERIGGGAFTPCPIVDFVIDPSHPFFTTYMNLLLSKDGRVCYSQIGCSSEVFVPDCVEEIVNGCFARQQKLLAVYFGDDSSLKRIGDEAFRFCGMHEIIIPKNVELLGKNCFDFCRRLTSVNFASSCPALKHLDDYAFSACGMTSIEIPDSVERLGEGCFRLCESLTRVHLGKDSALKVIGVNCFMGSRITSFWIPPSVKVIGGSAFSDTSALVDVNCDDNDNFCVSQHLLLSKDGRVCYSPIGGLREFAIPDSVEDIVDKGFYDAPVPRVIFGQNSALKRIGEKAFSGRNERSVSLRMVELPRGLEELGNRCFGGCRDLIEVRFLDITALKRIGPRPFVGCSRVHPALAELEARYGIKLR